MAKLEGKSAGKEVQASNKPTGLSERIDPKFGELIYSNKQALENYTS